MEKRKVSFHTVSRVVLIPSRSEYASADLTLILWWDDFDYVSFKASAIQELRDLMKSRDLMDTNEAAKILYQPGYEDRNMKIIPQSSTKSATHSVGEVHDLCHTIEKLHCGEHSRRKMPIQVVLI